MRVLVTGSAGFIGSVALRTLRERGVRTIAGVRARAGGTAASPLDASDSLGLDLLRPDSLSAALDSASPACVVHCAAMRDLGECERERDAATIVNYAGAAAIARWCAARSARMLFLSTDQVFDGSRAMAREEDPRRPINHYGVTKALAEDAVWEAGGVVVRVTLTLGLTKEGNRSPIDHVVSALRARQSVQLFSDEERSPILVEDVGEGLARLVERAMLGARCYHLAGPDRIDRYRLGVAIAERFGLDVGLCMSRLSVQTPSAVARPLLCSLDPSRLRQELGWGPRSLGEALAYLHAQSSSTARRSER